MNKKFFKVSLLIFLPIIILLAVFSICLKDAYVYDWDREDVRNRQQVLKMVGYDPFEWESDENKKILYKDLLNILEPGMENDLVKFQAAIQIVMSFFKVR